MTFINRYIRRVLLLSLFLGVFCATNAYADKALVQIHVNGRPAPKIVTLNQIAFLFEKSGEKYKWTNNKSFVSYQSSVYYNLPDDEQKWVVGLRTAGAHDLIYSPPLKAGEQIWDIKVIEGYITQNGKPVTGLVGQPVTVYEWKDGELSNETQPCDIQADGSFFIPEPEENTQYVTSFYHPDKGLIYSPVITKTKFTWDLNKNYPPRIKNLSEKWVLSNDRLVITVEGFDPNSDDISFAVDELPGFVTFYDWKNTTASFVVEPTDTDVGLHTINFVITDGQEKVVQKLNINVLAAQDAKAVKTQRNQPEYLTAIWANNGQDKVTQDELRSTQSKDVTNSVWKDGRIKLFGARNEVVAFNLILEVASKETPEIKVGFNRLEDKDGHAISSKKVSKEGVFSYVGRNIELFFVRYLQIKGVSRLLYNSSYDERHAPYRMQLPNIMARGKAFGKFEDRPGANKFYPDIAVPLEAVETFKIQKGNNQSVWCDIYIPKDAPAGIYKGNVRIFEGDENMVLVPVELEVLDFSLADESAAKTMVFFTNQDIDDRYFGQRWPNWVQAPLSKKARKQIIWNNHHLVAHRHKISLVDEGDTFKDPDIKNESVMSEAMRQWMRVLKGDLFTEKYGYDGPGVGVSSGVYSIGTYASWRKMWGEDNKEAMVAGSNRWVKWFETVLPDVEYFLYLWDEPGAQDFEKVEKWAKWIKDNPGPGHELKTLVTTKLVNQPKHFPSVDIVFTDWGDRAVWEPVVKEFQKQGKEYWAYNGWRPFTGSFAIEDEGVALRVLGWTHFKHDVERWFYWQSTHYKNSSHASVETDVFNTAVTFGRINNGWDAKYGQTGHNYSNGDGVLFYPGTELRYKSENYSLLGPISSLRLKLWRRGIQDVDYLTMAQAIDPKKVEEIVEKMIPKVLWEVGVDDPKDPTYVHTGISWPVDPDVWEEARRSLAEIIQ